MRTDTKTLKIFLDPIHGLRFDIDARILVVGPSGAGKSTFIAQCLRYLNSLFVGGKDKTLIYVYAVDPPSRDVCPDHHFKGALNEEDKEKLLKILKKENNSLLIIDDLFKDVNDDFYEKLFTVYSHHYNAAVILSSQNLFAQSNQYRTISLNCNYFVLFKNPRSAAQIGYLSAQIFPKNSKLLVSIYEEAVKEKPYSYLLINFSQNVPDSLRYASNIFDPLAISLYVPIRTR